MAEIEAAVDEFKSQLAAVSMPGEHQVDAKFGGAVEDGGSRLVCQQNVHAPRHHQSSSETAVQVPGPFRHRFAAHVVDADQVERAVATLNGCALLAQYVNALGGE